MSLIKTIKVLSVPEDRALLQPVLEQLRDKGVRVSEGGEPQKNDIVLAALTESFYADESSVKKLLDLVGAGAKYVLPLQLTAAAVPAEVKDALYSRNIIPAQGRDAGQIVQRVIDALPKKQSRLPLLLTAAAVVIAAAAGLLLWRSRAPQEAVPAMASAEAQFLLAQGLTEEDLALIEDVVIVGDRIELYKAEDVGMLNVVTNGNAQMISDWPIWDRFAYRTWQEDGVHFYDMEDAHEYALTRYEDLRFLGLLPNLKFLSLSLVEADSAALPDLRGAKDLTDVYLMDCALPDLDWLRGSAVTGMEIVNSTGSIRDFSPLTECAQLDFLYIDLVNTPEADFSRFAPPELRILFLNRGEELRSMDLSALSACAEMNDLNITGFNVTDVSFLTGMTELEYLRLESLPQLRSISAVSELKNLKDLEINYCARLADYSPIAGCTALESIRVQGDENPDALQDASFLADLPRLRSIGLYSCNLRNMDFLEGIAAHQDSIRLGFAGDIRDYSGLAYVKNYEYLHVNPRYQNGRGGDFSAVLPYIQDARIDYLMLYSCRGVDLSALPDDIGALSIRYGDLSDLGGLKPYSLRRLELWDCQYLTSLSGIESIPTLFGDHGEMELSVTGCPRMTDYSALEGAYPESLRLTGVYGMPDLTRLRGVNNLRLDSIEGLSDLHCLDGLNGGEDCNIFLAGLEGLYDLSPLRSLRGDILTVPPQVADQAEELVASGNFREYYIAYPDGSWQPFEGSVELLSLDELSALPKAMLARVERLCLVGDTLVDITGGYVREEWDDGADMPRFVFHSWNTEEETPIEYEAGTLAELGVFAELTGLRELRLYAQPLETLDGLQGFPALEHLTVAHCPALTDASAAFACQQLRYLALYGCPVESIQGAQNLQELAELNISGAAVTDLTPLLSLPALESVRVSSDMEEAIASLDGQSCSFALEIEGE